MSEQPTPLCPDCVELDLESTLARRDFLKVVGVGTAGVVAAGALPGATLADPPQAAPARQAKPAEALVRELYNSLSQDQRRTLVLPWNHGVGNNGQGIPSRLRMLNAAAHGQRIGQHYTRQQQELIERILRSISSDEEGYRRITRNGTFDGSGSLQGCGAHIYGDPSREGAQFAWVFTGHHLTVRCDGNSEPDAGFGGPMYYGHSPDGYSQRNCFYYQTQAVRSVYDALNEQQRRRAVLTGSPGEHAPSVQFRNTHPGIPASELTPDQRRLVEQVMRAILQPYRREDADEVMQIIRRNGGLERIHLAFYRDRESTDNARWHFWRLEGPGFVWNYRVLPHVHTYVNIAVRPQAQG